MILSQLICLLLLPTAAVSNLSPESKEALRGSLEAQLETAHEHEGQTVSKHLRTLRKKVNRGGGQEKDPSPGVVDPARNKFVVDRVQAHPTKKGDPEPDGDDGDLAQRFVSDLPHLVQGFLDDRIETTDFHYGVPQNFFISILSIRY